MTWEWVAFSLIAGIVAIMALAVVGKTVSDIVAANRSRRGSTSIIKQDREADRG